MGVDSLNSVDEKSKKLISSCEFLPKIIQVVNTNTYQIQTANILSNSSMMRMSDWMLLITLCTDIIVRHRSCTSVWISAK